MKKVAIVHYWLVGMRGGEKVIEALLSIYPEADIYTHVLDEAAISEKILRRVKGCTFINRLPAARKLYQSYLPLMPLALEQLDLRGYDLVISSESGPAKGVVTDPGVLHICYCHTPMRYIWDMYHDYRERAGWFKRLMMPLLAHYLRIWDWSSAQRVTYFVANSRFVAQRIRSFYNRPAEVIHPPVAVDEFCLSEGKDDYYLLVGELVGYKRADLAISAFAENGRRLKVVGGGEQFSELSRKAGANVEFLGKVDFSTLKTLYSRARALVFPGVEDFGIVPVEALASGTPVIAYAKGGALETVVPGKTGLLFAEQTPASLNAALDAFERCEGDFGPEALRVFARNFAVEEFVRKFSRLVDEKLEDKRADTVLG